VFLDRNAETLRRISHIAHLLKRPSDPYAYGNDSAGNGGPDSRGRQPGLLAEG
jgi:hypothetical protein